MLLDFEACCCLGFWPGLRSWQSGFLCSLKASPPSFSLTGYIQKMTRVYCANVLFELKYSSPIGSVVCNKVYVFVCVRPDVLAVCMESCTRQRALL